MARFTVYTLDYSLPINLAAALWTWRVVFRKSFAFPSLGMNLSSGVATNSGGPFTISTENPSLLKAR